MQKTILFSDLDGTLLDETSYSFRAAQPALNLVHERAIPLVLCSSKTRAEIEAIRQAMGNAHPFISENGGGIFIPPGYFSTPVSAVSCEGHQLIMLGMPYAEIRRHFDALRQQYGAKVTGFGDMTVEEIATLTGLSLKEAALAKQRDFDEPFIFAGEPDKAFLRAIEDAGLHWTQGRIFHILGPHDKGRAVQMLKALYAQEHGALSTIGLGDGLNDVPMLRSVDYPVLVRHIDGNLDLRSELPGLIITRQTGPSGWNEAVQQLLTGSSDGAIRPPDILASIFNAALEAVDPYQAVCRAVRLENDCLHVAGTFFPLQDYQRIMVLGGGKATARMAQAIEELLGERISAGLIVVKHGHAARMDRIEQIEASHPVPDEAGEMGARRMLAMAGRADARTLVICLLSGGASALLAAPAEGVTLADKQQVTDLLLRAGADIGELNAVRKHLSAIKGGRLAQAAFPATVLTLILSDVIGDRLDVIASGPTAPDHSSFADAWAVIEKYGLAQNLPENVMTFLQRGLAGEEKETVGADDPCFTVTHNHVVASLAQALAAAQKKARQLGLPGEILTDKLEGEARLAAVFLAQAARAAQFGMPAGEERCLLAGGETTVTVRGQGTGGRNQELALAFALEIAGCEGITLLSAGTDGSDGPTDAAGAQVDGDTASLARRFGIDPASYLANNDAYGFFQSLDARSGGHSHLRTGPTGTNVMDLQILLVSRKGLPGGEVALHEKAARGRKRR